MVHGPNYRPPYAAIVVDDKSGFVLHGNSESDKLGLKANQTINVEDAIKGLVTKSANDAAVVVAEAIGGSEDEVC